MEINSNYAGFYSNTLYGNKKESRQVAEADLSTSENSKDKVQAYYEGLCKKFPNITFNTSGALISGNKNKIVINLSSDCLKKMANDPEFAKKVEFNLTGIVPGHNGIYAKAKSDRVVIHGVTTVIDSEGNASVTCGGMTSANGTKQNSSLLDVDRKKERLEKRREEKKTMERLKEKCKEKTGQTDKETTGIVNQFDRMEITPASQTAIPSENYNNIRNNKTTYLAFTRGNAQNGYYNKIANYMYQYCQGEFSNDELKQKFTDICNEVYENNYNLGYISETDNEGKLRLITEVYAFFQNGNAGAIAKLCMDAGTGIASQYGDNDIGWVYYDTEYRNKSEKIHEFLKGIANEISNDWGGLSLDFGKIENDSEVMPVTGKDFDACWNYYARGRNMCSLKDIKNPDFSETVSSGERFSFFYKAVAAPGREGENTLETQKGVILLELGERKWKLDVPFNNSTVLGDLAYNFNVGSLFERYANDNPMMLKLLKHFNVFSLFCRRDII